MADITGGGLHFKTTIDNQELDKAIAQSEQRIKNFSKEAISGFGGLDDALNLNKENLVIQKNVIADLEKEYKELQAQIEKIGPGRAHAKLISESKELGIEIENEKKALQEMESVLKEAEKANVTYTKRTRELKNALAEMENQGLRGTAMYKETQKELQQTARAMRDVNQQTKVLTHSSSGLQGVISGLSGLSGAFSAVAGTMGLFAGKNANLQKIMTRVQSLMGITVGLQQVQQTLYKDSAFRVVTLTKLKELYNKVTGKTAIAETAETASKTAQTVAQEGQIAVAKKGVLANTMLGRSFQMLGGAIKSIPVFGWIAAGITVLVDVFAHFRSKAKEARKEIEEFNQSVVDLAIEPIAKIEQLSMAWQRLGNDMEAKEKFVKANADAFKELGAEIKSVADAENLLIKQKGAYINAQIEKAKADVFFQKYKSDLAEIAKKELALEDKTYGDIMDMETRKVDRSKVDFDISDEAVSNIEKQFSKHFEEIDDLRAGLNNSYENFSKHEAISLDKMREAGIGTIKKYSDGTIGALEQAIAREKETLEGLKDNNEAYKDKLIEIQELERQLNELVDISEKKVVEEKTKKPEIDPSIEAERKELERLLDSYGTFYDERLRQEAEYNRDILALEKALSEAKEQSVKDEILLAIENRKQAYNEILDAEYNRLLESHKGYEEQREDISEQFDKQIALAREKGNADLEQKLIKEKAKAISKITLSEFTDSESWNELFGNLDRLTVDRMIELRNRLESEWKQLDLSPDELDALRNKIDEVNKRIAERNPFKALKDALERYKDEEQDVDFNELAENAYKAFKMVMDSVNQVIDALNELGLTGDEITSKLISDVAGFVSSAGELAMGLVTMNPMRIVSGTIGVITKGFEIFDVKSRKAERSVQKHLKVVADLERQYNKLEREVSKAIGTEKFDLQREQIKNHGKQIIELEKAIEAESKKRKSKRDDSKIQAWKDEILQLTYAIEDTEQSIIDSLTGTSVEQFASQLTNSLVDAFMAGEDSALAFDKTYKQVMQNVLKNTLQKNVIESALKPVIDYLEVALKYDGKLDDRELNTLGGMYKVAGRNIESGLEAMKPAFDMLRIGDDEDTTSKSLSGAIKGVTEQTASLIGGQMNAIRINQLESTVLIRDQLLHLSNISQNTRYIKMIYDKITTGDGVRSQGAF